MNPELLSLIMDFVVLMALAGTIYYALRLSRSLNAFKSHREELKTLILDLSTHIDQAQKAIGGLKNASDNAATELDDVLHDSRRMAEELKMINDSANAMASRLEGLASGASRNARQDAPNYDYDDEDADVGFDEGDHAEVLAAIRQGRKEADVKKDMDAPPSFFIKDADHMRDDDEAEGDLAGGEFVSQAEKELYQALQKNKKQSGGGLKS